MALKHIIVEWNRECSKCAFVHITIQIKHTITGILCLFNGDEPHIPINYGNIFYLWQT